MESYKYYIGKEFKEAKDKIKVINPSTEEAFALISETSEEDLNLALTKAKSAAKEWKKTPFKQRAKVLREISKAILDNLQHLAELETTEIGKPLKESLFVDVPLGAECFNYYASFLESLSEESLESESGIDLIKYEPFGVAGVFLPYNVPLMIFGFTCAAAIAAGNSLIIKPSEFGSLSMLELAKYISELDIPEGLINIVSGSGRTLGKSLAKSSVDIISFTGSRDTLKQVVLESANSPKKIVCELGGCNISVVFSDADKDEALQNILAASFMKQGQICIGTSLALVEEGSYQDFVDKLVKAAKSIKIGGPFDSTAGMGPLVTKEHLYNVDKKVKKVLSKGGKLLCGAEPLKTKGYFYPPTVIEVEDIIYEEFFAPVVLVKSFKGRKEAQKILEENPTGLVTQIWAKDLDKANDLAAAVNCGTVWINTFVQMSPQTPFGGQGKSGWGRNLGKAGFFEYIQPKHIGIGFKSSPVKGWFGL